MKHLPIIFPINKPTPSFVVEIPSKVEIQEMYKPSRRSPMRRQRPK